MKTTRILKTRILHWRKSHLLLSFRKWCRHTKYEYEKDYELLTREKVNALDHMFEVREAVRTWKYVVCLVRMEERYRLQLKIHEDRIHLMITKFRTIQLPTHLKHANRLHMKTLRELRAIIGALQNISFEKSKRHIWTPSGSNKTAEEWWTEGMYIDHNLEAMYVRKMAEAMVTKNDEMQHSSRNKRQQSMLLKDCDDSNVGKGEKVEEEDVPLALSDLQFIQDIEEMTSGVEIGSSTSTPSRQRKSTCQRRGTPIRKKRRELSIGIRNLGSGSHSNRSNRSNRSNHSSSVSVLYGDRSHHADTLTMRERIVKQDQRTTLNSTTKNREFGAVFDLAQEYKNLVEVAQDAIVEEAVHEARSTLRSRLRERVLEISQGLDTGRSGGGDGGGSSSWKRSGALHDDVNDNERNPVTPLATTRTFSTLSQQWTTAPLPSERFDLPDEKSSLSGGLSFRHPEASTGLISVGKKHGVSDMSNMA
jgi:hypothetical protein